MRNPLSKEHEPMRGSERNQSCEARVDLELKDRLTNLKRLWTAYCDGSDDEQDESITDYGLGFDYVPARTFCGQREAYFRYQLSCGGPSDEFRFFVNPDLSCHRIEYWFLDWFDGANRVLTGEDDQLLSELWEWFRETGSAQAALKHAQVT
jgi:hypothetical protein